MKRPALRLVCFWCLGIASTGRLTAQPASPSLEERFRAEFPAAVLKNEEIFKHISGSGHYAIYFLNEEEIAKAKQKAPGLSLAHRDRANMIKRKSQDVRFAFDGPLMKATMRPTLGFERGPGSSTDTKRPPPLDFEGAGCVNRRSAFQVAWAKEGSPPRLLEVSEPSNDRIENIIQAHTSLYFDRIMRLWKVPREKFFPSPDFIVKKFTTTTADGVELLRVDFEIKYGAEELAKDAKSGASARLTTSGWFVVRPDDGWVIQESMVSNTLRGNDAYARVEYGAKQDGVLLPKEILLASTFGDNVLSLDTIRHGPTPESEFTLTAFGLPEINQTPTVDNPNRTAYWLIGAGVIVLVAAIGLKFYAGRSRVAA